jgi:DNA-3-methyladenine glycosylase
VGLDALRDALSRDVLAAAPLLLGSILRRGSLSARIVEVEAYRADDPACHAFGRTRMKNMALFGEPGTAYVYFNYGMHWMLNVVAHPVGDPAALLVRAAEPLTGLAAMASRRPKAKCDQDLLSGPGKLASAFEVTKSLNGIDLLSADALHLELGVPPSNVLVGARIGIAAGKGHDFPWRFVDGDALAWVSKPLPK